MIRLQFVLGTGISSQAIAWFSAGVFSHVDAVLSDGTLLGARSDKADGISGVAVRKPFYERWKRRVVMSLTVEPQKETLFNQFLDRQIGKPYDNTAIWGFVAGRNWREEDSWFCSELLTAALETATIFPTLYTPRDKVTPAALALLMSDHEATIS
jgi:hypothetical protein